MPDWILFFAIVVGIPVVFGVLSDVHKRHLRHKEREMELRHRSGALSDEEYIARIERLEDRVRVLERIITDKGHQLADEIERLRDKPLN